MQLPDATVLRIPSEWTDLSIPDPYHLAGLGRASFRVPDLLQLRTLLHRFLAQAR